MRIIIQCFILLFFVKVTFAQPQNLDRTWAFNQLVDNMNTNLSIINSGDYQISSYPYQLVPIEDKIIDLNSYYAKHISNRSFSTSSIAIDPLLDDLPKNGYIIINAIGVRQNSISVGKNSVSNIHPVIQYHYVNENGQLKYAIDKNLNYKFEESELSNGYKSNMTETISLRNNISFDVSIPSILSNSNEYKTSLKRSFLMNFQKKDEFAYWKFNSGKKIKLSIESTAGVSLRGKDRFTLSKNTNGSIKRTYQYNIGTIEGTGLFSYKNTSGLVTISSSRIEPADYTLIRTEGENESVTKQQSNQFIPRKESGFGLGIRQNLALGSLINSFIGINYLWHRYSEKEDYVSLYRSINPNFGVHFKASEESKVSLMFKVSFLFYKYEFSDNGKELLVRETSTTDSPNIYNLVDQNKNHVTISFGAKYRIY